MPYEGQMDACLSARDFIGFIGFSLFPLCFEVREFTNQLLLRDFLVNTCISSS